MQPIRRDLKFKLPVDRLRNWNPHGLHVTHFFNTLSIFFPSGERFFIDSVRYYRERGDIRSEELLKAVNAFIGQEAMHGREHEDYNAALAAAGLPIEKLEARVIALLKFLQRRLPPSARLAVTVALEHFTAIMANGLLNEPAVLDGAAPRFAALWRWHALEETEHKAVAYDVYEAAVGKGPVAYLLRSAALLGATFLFWGLVIPFHFALVRRDGGAGDLRGWAALFRFHWLRPGVLRRLIPDYLDFYRPGFHPWQHDNRHFLAEIDGIAQAYRAAA